MGGQAGREGTTRGIVLYQELAIIKENFRCSTVVIESTWRIVNICGCAWLSPAAGLCESFTGFERGRWPRLDSPQTVCDYIGSELKKKLFSQFSRRITRVLFSNSNACHYFQLRLLLLHSLTGQVLALTHTNKHFIMSQGTILKTFIHRRRRTVEQNM